MIPTALSSQLEQGIADFLRMSFWSSTPSMEGVIERLISTPGGILKGPYISVNLPFQQGGDSEFFPNVPLGFPAHRHQEQAFSRLSGAKLQSTLIATGTGSGKTESFLWPILDHCRRNVGKPGIKAILIYPMNALATDQAGRMAKAIEGNAQLKGAVRAGLYIGESKGEKRSAHKTMGADHIITDRQSMRLNPPDILLTNYKMLDYLLIRPGDQELWAQNLAGALRFLVVDELHTFDGAQGTDLACLIRRLKARLGVDSGELCCVGTSATLGGEAGADTLRTYAEDIFGEPFKGDAVVTEQRLSRDEFLAEHYVGHIETVSSEMRLQLDPSRFPSPEEYVLTQYGLWFDEPLAGEPWSDAWRVALGDQLMRHATLTNLLKELGTTPTGVNTLVAAFSRSRRELREDPELTRLAIISFLSLVSEARSWVPERLDAKQAREAAGMPRRTRPFLEVRLQLWQREMARMVGDVTKEPTLRYTDDLTKAQLRHHLPMLHCRDCGALGWATLQSRDKPDLYRTGNRQFYAAFFSNDPQVCFLWPDAAAPKTEQWRTAQRFALNSDTLVRERDDGDGIDESKVVRVVVSHSVRTEKGQKKLDRNCPFCAAHGSLTLIGFRAATLTSIYIDQLFASRFNNDKKLLTFSDSVQDASHRAGFFGARTWRFNLRVALQHVLSQSQGVTLDQLPDAFTAHWRDGSAASNEAFAYRFLAPNMDWLPDYLALQESGELPKGTTLLQEIDRRIAFEIFTEFGLQARIGRSLPRMGCATVRVDDELLATATDALLEPLRNEVGGLRALDRTTLHYFLAGALHHLRERGGIDHDELPEDFVLSGGRDTHVFNRRRHLPAFGRSSRMPTLITDDSKSPRFDTVLHGGGANWYARWVERCFAGVSALIGAPTDVWSLVLPCLTEHKILQATDGKHGRVWGLRPAALQVSSDVVRLRCSQCAHWLSVAQAEVAIFDGGLCLTARCTGVYAADDADTNDYFGRLYRLGEVERVFAAEHTGLLTRPARETVEREFKAEASERQPSFPNLLSCTPTLEMGIDIGALSSAILCSVPPAQSNYLQRIGRAGRRDGNSLLLTVAQAKPHDLYFYADPELMISGMVSPPGIFLNASAVLERQLAAYCLDQWNAQGIPKDAIPRQLTAVFDNLENQSKTRFPHNWLDFVAGRDEELLSAFIQLFGDRIGEGARIHLRAFLMGDKKDQGSLGWKVLDALHKERQQRDSLRSQGRKVKKAFEKLEAAKAKNKDHDEQLRERRREQHALERLVKNIERKSVLEFLTDRGLLPNYAFPESPIQLSSVIWRKKQEVSSKDKSKYETQTYDYARPAMAALSELAPENRFFAGGRHVIIDQVDLATAKLETWRFCDQCAYSKCIDSGDLVKDCPQCLSHGWGEDSQKRQLLQLKQVFARTSDRRSRIRDDQEQRQPRHFNRRMLMSFEDHNRDGAWHINEPATPFAFEYLRHARFNEINFGEYSDSGTKFSISGRDEVRHGFLICKHCGKVQPKPPKKENAPPVKPEHTLWCTARKKEADSKDFEESIYLYREFSSEAIRLLLPLSDVGTDIQLNSFMAAFQLGLRNKYGGRVDHLHTLVYSEPQEDSLLRRQYLVLYDSVPGGTGYLKDFTRPSEGDDIHPLMDILRRSLDLLTTCTCNHKVEQDGCYRCLFAYRNSRDMSETSRSAAVDILTPILAHAGKLEPIDALSSVSVNGMMDSVLEARFIEALRRLGTADRPVQVEKALVRNKPGFRVNIGGVVWNIEQQLALTTAEGFNPAVSIDFVFRPASRRGGRRPIAVFLDGYKYHQNRIGHDLWQRMTLVSSGKYDVWNFNWYDVDEVFHTEGTPAPFTLHPDLPSLLPRLKAWGSELPTAMFDQGMMVNFADTLASSSGLDAWEHLAAAVTLSQFAGGTVDTLKTWKQEVLQRAPSGASQWFDQVQEDWYLLRRPPAPEAPHGLWAAAPKTALVVAPGKTPVIDASQFVLLAWLDDSPEQRQMPEFLQHWRGFLQQYQFLRALPHAWFLAPHDQDERDYLPLSLARESTFGGDDHSDLWDELDADGDYAPIVDALRSAASDLPEVGIDLLDARGHTAGVEGELVWEASKVAVVDSLEDAERPVDPDWAVFERDMLLQDPEPLIAALAARGAH